MLKTASLTPFEVSVIRDKCTENPGSGEYNELEQSGTYLCRNCGLALYRAEHKFLSGGGWPSYDLEIPGTVRSQPDADGRRSEILCARCDAHLGHVFIGEGYTSLNTRHCVNSVAIDFVTNDKVLDTEEIILAAGCFWGVEYYMQKLPGVLKTVVGYTGGGLSYPTYQDVCGHKSGHLEAIRIVYDPKVIPLIDLLKYFFEIHDPTQVNGQGPDIGNQYLSGIFYYTDEQLNIANDLIGVLTTKGLSVVTALHPVCVFWPAEDLHQNYYSRQNGTPYCHIWQKKF